MSDTFQSETILPLVTWELGKLHPPSELYMAHDDQLVLQAMSSLTGEVVTISARVLTVDGIIVPVQLSLAALGLFGKAAQVMSGVEGFLISLSVVATSAAQRGQTFVRAWINRGATSAANNVHLLVADYATYYQAASWPMGSLKHGTDGNGELISVHLNNPVPGIDFGFTCNPNQRVRIVSISAQLQTSAVAGSRNVQAIISDGGGNRVFQASATASIPASTTALVTIAPGLWNVGAVATNVMVPLAVNPVMTLGFNFTTLTVGILAGDQWSNVYVYQERWFDQL